MKILVVGPYPPPYSGPETSIKLLMESPLREMTDLRLLNINYRKDMASKGRIDLSALMAFFMIQLRLMIQCVRFRPDIVYYYVTATKTGWLLKDIWIIMTAALFRRKVVIHMRAGHFKFVYDAMSRWSQRVIRFACRRCALAFVQGERLRNQFDGLVAPEKVKVVYNMIDVEKFENPEPAHYDLQRFFFMGHLSCAKGYCDLLAVMPRILAEFPACKFVFAGYKLEKERNVFYEQTTGREIVMEDPEEAYRNYIAGKFEANYEYLGPIGDEAKIREIKRCTAFVLPSYSEGFSMAVLEALSLGKPVICTPVGALGEVVRDGENGLVVPAGDRDALFEALRRMLLDSTLRRDIIARNHQYVADHFSQLVVAQKLYAEFSALVSEA
jgi:glycosyltransferase involved in cell wall biosynthesis